MFALTNGKNPGLRYLSTISESLCTKASSLDEDTSKISDSEHATSHTSDYNNDENKSSVNIDTLVEECFREFVEI